MIANHFIKQRYGIFLNTQIFKFYLNIPYRIGSIIQLMSQYNVFLFSFKLPSKSFLSNKIWDKFIYGFFQKKAGTL